MLVDDSFQFGFVSFVLAARLDPKLFRFQVDAANNPDAGAESSALILSLADQSFVDSDCVMLAADFAFLLVDIIQVSQSHLAGV